jgi:hypothetical protein
MNRTKYVLEVFIVCISQPEYVPVQYFIMQANVARYSTIRCKTWRFNENKSLSTVTGINCHDNCVFAVLLHSDSLKKTLLVSVLRFTTGIY